MAQQRGTLKRLERALLKPNEGLTALHHLIFSSTVHEQVTHVLAARLKWQFFAPILQRATPCVDGSAQQRFASFLTIRNMSVASEGNVGETIEGFIQLSKYCDFLLLHQIQLKDVCLQESSEVDMNFVAQDVGIEAKYLQLFAAFFDIFERNDWLESVPAYTRSLTFLL